MREAKIILRVPAVIRKADITPLLQYEGRTNAATYQGHAPQALQYVTFAGARRADGLYAGEYRFAAAEPNALDVADFAKLPNVTEAADGDI